MRTVRMRDRLNSSTVASVQKGSLFVYEIRSQVKDTWKFPFVSADLSKLIGLTIGSLESATYNGPRG